MIPDAVLPHDGLRKYSAPDFTVPGLVFLLFPREVYLILGVRNNVCPLYWMSPGPGKCLGFVVNWFTFLVVFR